MSDIDQELLIATERPSRYIDQSNYLGTVKKAIFTDDKRCQVVLVKGEGGLGKTRLLEEILRHLGHQEMIPKYGPLPVEESWDNQFIVSTRLLDFININLHDRDTFLAYLANGKTWRLHPEIRFDRFSEKNVEATRLKDAGAGYSLWKEKVDLSQQAFLEDYLENTKHHRLVWILDTAEQLSMLHAQWLVKHNLLEDNDLQFSTQQWLIDRITKGDFPNTTIILAGRAEEGKWFFNRLEEKLIQYTEHCHLTTIKAEPFTLVETRQFFLSLGQDWSKHDDSGLAHMFRTIAENEDRVKVLHLYTGGQPVRLSLYADLLYEGLIYPESLKDSYEEALKRTKVDKNNFQPTEELIREQKLIEQSFIHLLFTKPDEKSEILKLLVRATRGLTAKQLYFLLHSKGSDNVLEWDKTVKRDKTHLLELSKLTKLLDSINKLSIVKCDFNELEGEKDEAIYRLQDEMYRIYAEVLSESDKARVKETQERQVLYKKIIRWLEPQRQKAYQERTALLKKYIDNIYIASPERISDSSLGTFSKIESEKSKKLKNQLIKLDLEYLHYSLLIDPYTHFNNTYFNLVYQKNIAEDIQVGNLFRSEVYRTLHEPYHESFLFLDIPDPEPADSHVATIRRMVEQYEAAHWILIFTMRNENSRAVKLATEIEEAIKKETVPHVQASWSGLFAQAERLCWSAYAKIGIAPLKEIIAELEKFNSEELIQKLNKYNEDPKYIRLRFVLAEMYNTLGFCHTQLGLYEKAVTYFVKGEQILREIGDLHEQVAVSLNNKSRAIAEMGLSRAILICLDGLNLRLQQGEDFYALALSYNTLGLIYNHLYQPDKAIEACARAYALAKVVSDERILGLVQIQLASALRRLPFFIPTAVEKLKGREDLYLVAESLLEHASESFKKTYHGKPNFRSIEVLIAQGCLYRDWIRLMADVEETDAYYEYYDKAVALFERAITLASVQKFDRLLIEAMGNLAWAHYRVKDYEKIKDAIAHTAEQIQKIAPSAFFEKGVTPPHPSEKTEEFSPHYVFKELCRLEHLKGLVAYAQVIELDENGTEEDKKSENYQTQMSQYLKEMAYAYAFAITYAEIFSPNNSQLPLIYDVLYGHLKKFGTAKLKTYYYYDAECRKTYCLDELIPQDMGNTAPFLRHSFGDYYEDGFNES